MALASQGYGTPSNESHSFPWPTLENEPGVTLTCEGADVTPRIYAKVEKGFFLSPSDRSWTCYRRNYFSVVTSFELHPCIANGRIMLNGNLVRATGMRLAAVVDGHQGKKVELIQHTPKRDQGPKTTIEIVKIAPTPPQTRAGEQTVSPNHVYRVPMQTFHHTGLVPSPYLPLQNTPESPTPSSGSTTSSSQVSSPTYPYNSVPGSALPMQGQSNMHTFERVQFKSATANNGKRRASQQYFHLMVELYGDTRPEGSETPRWQRIAYKVSEKIVVRGRSPSHYSNEGGHTGSGGRGGSASAGPSGYGSGGSYSSATSRGGFGGSSSGYGNASTGGFRSSTQYNMAAGTEYDGGSSSGASSINGGPGVDVKHPMEPSVGAAEDAQMHDYDGYQYYPSTLYEGVPVQAGAAKQDGHGQQGVGQITLPGFAYVNEPRKYSIKEEYAHAVPGSEWTVGNCGRYQGVETSRGYYPGLNAGY